MRRLLFVAAAILSLAATCRPQPPTPPTPPAMYRLTAHVTLRDVAVPNAQVTSIGGVPAGPYGVTDASGTLELSLIAQDFTLCAQRLVPATDRACVGVRLHADMDVTIALPVPPTPPEDHLVGQFVIPCAGCPYGPRPGASDNVIFLAELDTIWRENPTLAETILSGYKAGGANAIVVNTAVAGGYHGQYPAHNYVGRGDDYARYVEWVQDHGLRASVWILPDLPPYYDSGARAFDWSAIERDLTPIYTNPRLQAQVRKVVYMWEDYQRSSEMVHGYDYLTRVFPHATEYAWHNPPGHSGPGMGDENEHDIWTVAAAHGITTLYYQAWPPSTDPIPGKPVGPPIEQLKYDLWDMLRRFHGDAGAPWGPVLARDGQPLRVVWAEGTAYSIYNDHYAPSIGATWRDAALSVAGVTDTLDGLPAH